MERITQKQFLLTGFLEYLIRKEFAKIIKIITPGSVSDRGSQLSLVFDRDLKEVHEKLEANNVSVSHVLPDVPTSFRHEFRKGEKNRESLFTFQISLQFDKLFGKKFQNYNFAKFENFTKKLLI